MKAEIRVSTAQYEYTNFEVEGTLEQIREYEKEVRDSYKERVGIPDKDFNSFLEEYVNTGSVKEGTEVYALMNEYQKYTIQQLKKLFKRINYKK